MSGMFFIVSVLMATAISMIGLSLFAKKAFDAATPQALSEMATTSHARMAVFRVILITCSILFFITLIGFIAPASQTSNMIAAAALAMCLSEIILAIVPASKGLARFVHNVLGYVMGAAMFALVLFFWLTLTGGSRLAELCIAVMIILFFFGMLLDKSRFIFYELAYIYLSHISIVLIAITFSLR